jgi:hypothetical protein
MAQQTIDLSYNSASLIYSATSVPAGVFTPILSWQVPFQAGWYIPRHPLLLAYLVNSSATQVPVNAELILSYQRPTDQLPTSLSSSISYAFYYNHSLAQQSSSVYLQFVQMPLYTDKSFVQNTILSLLIKVPSAFTLDWTVVPSQVYIKSLTQVDATA